MRRADVMQAIADVIGIAKIVASSIGASGSTELKVQASADDPAKDTSEWWGHPAIACKPPAGGEALYVDLNGERLVFGVKERRWQVSVADGECIVRALGAGTPAYIKLKPDGTCEIHATTIKLGGDTATAAVPLNTLLQTNLAAIAAAFNTLGITYAPTPTASATVKAL
jgi:hypothetical protein